MNATRWSGMIGLMALALTACGGVSTPGVVSGNSGALKTGAPLASIPVTNQPMSTDEQKIFDDVNAARAQPRTCGTVSFAAAGKLTWSAQLQAAARAHSEDMAQNGYREVTPGELDAPHNGSDGSTPQQRITATGYSWQISGENVAAGYTVGGVNDVVVGWLNSPSHCENIMNPKFSEIGVSYIVNDNMKYNRFFTQDFGSQ